MFTTFFAGVFVLFAKPWRALGGLLEDGPALGRAGPRRLRHRGPARHLRLHEHSAGQVYALIFLSPLFVTILSMLVLKEKVGPWRWFAVVAGFAGVMLVVRPGFRELELGHLAAFGIAFLPPPRLSC